MRILEDFSDEIAEVIGHYQVDGRMIQMTDRVKGETWSTRFVLKRLSSLFIDADAVAVEIALDLYEMVADGLITADGDVHVGNRVSFLLLDEEMPSGERLGRIVYEVRTEGA